MIQTDWFAESEHGGLYEMMGDDYTVDKDNMRVKGSLMAGGQDTGIDLEVRMGGPAIGFEAPRAQIYTDDSINLAYSNIDAQMLAWNDDPAGGDHGAAGDQPADHHVGPGHVPRRQDHRRPRHEARHDQHLPRLRVRRRVRGPGHLVEGPGRPVVRRLPGPVHPGARHRPAGIRLGRAVHLRVRSTEYGKQVAYQLLNDAGYPTYSQTLSVLPENVDAMAACWRSSSRSPSRRRSTSSTTRPGRTRSSSTPSSRSTRSGSTPTGLADYSVQTQKDLGLVGNGPDDTLGNFDPARVEQMLQILRDAGADVPSDLTAEEMYTNQFLDPSIGL